MLSLQHEDFAFDPRALGRATVVLFDRAMGVAALGLSPVVRGYVSQLSGQ